MAEVSPTCDAFKASGDLHLKDNNYHEAIKSYNKALELCPNNPDVLSTRSSAYLIIGDFGKSLNDSEAVLAIKPTDFKSKHRKARALIGLRRYLDVVVFLDSCEMHHRQENAFCYFTQLKDKLLLHLAGVFDMNYFLSKARVSPYTEYTEYVGPINVCNILGKGRGTVATTTIKPGDLIVVSKAVAMVSDEIGDSLESAILGELQINPDLEEEVFELYAGPGADKIPKSDYLSKLKYLEKVCLYNSFSTEAEEGESGRKVGLWLKPSYFNHSCVRTNCWSMILQDFMFVRATREIKPGDEILVNYATNHLPFAERETFLKGYHFKCFCDLCKLERTEPHVIRKSRARILKFVANFKDNRAHTLTKLAELKNIIANIKKLRSDEKLNFPLFAAEDKLISHYCALGRFDVAGLMHEHRFHLTVDVDNQLALEALCKAMHLFKMGNMVPQIVKLQPTFQEQMRIYFGNGNINVEAVIAFIIGY